MLTDRQSQWKALDCFRRKLTLKYELKRRLLKLIKINTTLPLAQRYLALVKLTNIPKSSSITKIQNRCIVSGRNHSVLRKTQYCRFVFRHKAYTATLPGIRRSSW